LCLGGVIADHCNEQVGDAGRPHVAERLSEPGPDSGESGHNRIVAEIHAGMSLNTLAA